MLHTNYSELRSQLDNGSITAKTVVANYLENIAKANDLNAFNEVFALEATQQAEKVDEKLKAGTAGRLAGMVIAIKDNIAIEGHILTASSKILGDFKSLYSSTVVQRLVAEDAIIIGRTNCDEFAMGSSNENSAFGVVKNPLDTSRVPGGSSGGSAAAVAANLCHAAIGTDTGGSIRQPAAYCGIVGLKPTYGLVSRHGLVAFGSSFDQAGPLTRSIDDSFLIVDIIKGQDGKDATLTNQSVEVLLSEKPSKKLKIAVLKESISSDGIDAEQKAELLKLLEKLKQEGHSVEIIDFPLLKYGIPVYYLLSTAEASSNLSRYGGVGFGYRSENAKDLESTYKKSRTEGFGKEVKRRIMLGTFVLSEGYYDAYYTKAQKVRRMVVDNLNARFAEGFDVILTPTTTGVAFKIGEKTDDPLKLYLEDIFTVTANLAGLPSISIPFSKNSEGLPFGLLLTAPAFMEKELFAASVQIEKLIQ